MPGVAIGVGLGVGGSRERVVRAATFVCGRGAIDRRPHERVTELHTGPDLEQLLVRRGFRRLPSDAEGVGGAPDQRRVSGRVGGGQQRQSLRLVRQCADAPEVAGLDLPLHVTTVEKSEAARQLCCAHASRELQQRQRVAAGLGDDAVPHVVVESTRDDGREQGPRVLLWEPLQRHLRQSGERPVVAVIAHGDHDRHRLGEQPTRHETEDLAGGAVEPLPVVDQAQQGTLLATVRQQAQRGQRDQEAVGSVARRQAERDAQRVAAAAPGAGRAESSSERRAGAGPRRATPSPTRRI